MQGLFEDLRSMKRWHVQCWHAATVTRSWVTLSGEWCSTHVWRWSRALIVVLPLSSLFVKGQSQPFTFLSAVTEPHAHHLKQTHATSQKKPKQSQNLTQCQHISFYIHLFPNQDHQICAWFPVCWAWDTSESRTRGQCGLNPLSWSSFFFFLCPQKPAPLCTSEQTKKKVSVKILAAEKNFNHGPKVLLPSIFTHSPNQYKQCRSVNSTVMWLYKAICKKA